jgi:hypothetical protein
MFLSIDGAAPAELKIADSDGKFIAISHEVELSAEGHEIRLFNSWSKMPIIDMMMVHEAR